MDDIKRTARQIKLAYIILWLSALALVVVGELGDSAWVGWYAGRPRLAYVVESAVILLTVVCIPLSLKAFAWALGRWVGKVDLPIAMRRYALWSRLRMVLLGLPLWSGLLTYYLLLSRTGALCALIALTASLFCVPSQSRLRRELHLDD